MSDLHFSAEAIEVAKITYDQNLIRRQMFLGSLDITRDCLRVALDAALAHDAERLAREIIEQRVTSLSEGQIEKIGWSREWLLRALTEQPEIGPLCHVCYKPLDHVHKEGEEYERNS